jgi:hypothetical protein
MYTTALGPRKVVANKSGSSGMLEELVEEAEEIWFIMKSET